LLRFSNHFSPTPTSAIGNFRDPNGGLITNITPIIRQNSLVGVLADSFPLGALQSNGTYVCPNYMFQNFCIDRGFLNAYFLQKKVEFVYTSQNGQRITLNQAVAYDEDRIKLKPPTSGWLASESAA
jgi:hypothetical protein